MDFCDSQTEGGNSYTTNALYANATDTNITREEPLRRRDSSNTTECLEFNDETTTEEHANDGACNKRKERRRRRERRHTVSLEGFSRTNLCAMRRASRRKRRRDQRGRGSLHIASFSRTSAMMICCIVAATVRGQSPLENTTEPSRSRTPITPTSMPSVAPPAANGSVVSAHPSSPPSSTFPPTSEKTFDPSRFPSTAPSTPEPTQGPSQHPSGVPSITMAPTTLPSYVPSVSPSVAPSREAVPLPPKKITKALSIGFSVPIVLFAIATLIFLARRKLAKRDAAAAKMNPSVTIIKEIAPGIEHLGDNARSSRVHSADDNAMKWNESVDTIPSVDINTAYSNTRGNSVSFCEENGVEIQAAQEDYVAALDGRSKMQDDDDKGGAADSSTSRDIKALTWGTTDGDHMEIEASVFCETNDWLRRNRGADLKERHKFAQQLVKRMVASVSFNVITPNDASRAIHGAIAMLGLPLGVDVEVPRTTILVSSMPKNVTRQDMVDAFQRFGLLEGAAVSPNERGFGLVRYLSPRSVQRATDHFQTYEINVQDAAVDIKALSHYFPERKSQVQFAV